MKKIFLIVYIIIPLTSISQNNWEGFGQGISGHLRCFYEDTLNDRLIVGGAFTAIDTFQNNSLAVWDGEKWDCFSEGPQGSQIYSIIKYLDTLYIAGTFWGWWGGDTLFNIAKWNGSNWQAVNIQNSEDLYIRNMRVINNELYIIGGFDSINNYAANGLAKYNGSEWSNVHNLPCYNCSTSNPNILNDIAYYKGELYVGGNFSNQSLNIHDIVKYNGVEWVSVGVGGIKGSYSGVNRMVVYNNELIVTGVMYKSNGNIGNFTQKWDGTKWSEFINLAGYNNYYDSNAEVKEMKIHNGKLYISGVFIYANDMLCEKILVWDGQQICSFGSDFYNNINTFGFYRDTLFIQGPDSIDHIATGGINYWTGGNYIDTCSFVQSINNNYNKSKATKIYPNPTKGKIKIKAEDIKQVEVYNIHGEKIKSIEYRTDKSIDLTAISKGVYIVKVIGGDYCVSKKVIMN